MTSEMLTTAEAAALLKCSVGHVYQLRYQGIIASHKPNGKIYFRKADLLAYLNRNRRESNATLADRVDRGLA